MYIGQLIMSGQTAYTPWMQRGGDSARFTYQFILAGGSVPFNTNPSDEVQFRVYTKNSEDEGDGDAVGSGVSLTSTGFGVEDISGTSGLKELVRFEIVCPEVSVSVDSNPWTIARWVYFRILAPVWYNKA